MDNERQTGRTTRQIQNAPMEAFYVVPHIEAVKYTEALCHKHNRPDLKIIPISIIQRHGYEFLKGRRDISIIIDHEIFNRMTATQIDELLFYLKLNEYRNKESISS